MNIRTAIGKIQRVIKKYKTQPDKIGYLLVSERIPHLSYSMISSYEFCPRKYFLEYVKQIRLRPEPLYFVKGNVLHSAAKNLYSRDASSDLKHILKKSMFSKIKSPEDKKHLENAVNLMIENRWNDEWEVLAVELPFVMPIHDELPPFFGIIDLILRKGNQHVVVDHKTGKYIYELDPMQLVFYREFVRQTYDAKKVYTYYDQYRWVNNLDRIRKPAFMRSNIPLRKNEIAKAITRAKRAYKGMSKITGPVFVSFSEMCYSCQFRLNCS